MTSGEDDPPPLHEVHVAELDEAAA